MGPASPENLHRKYFALETIVRPARMCIAQFASGGLMWVLREIFRAVHRVLVECTNRKSVVGDSTRVSEDEQRGANHSLSVLRT